jgi:hypothetical protein
LIVAQGFHVNRRGMLLNAAAKANCQRAIFVTAEQPRLHDSFPLDGAGWFAGDAETGQGTLRRRHRTITIGRLGPLGRPQEPQHTPRQGSRAAVMFDFEPNLARERERPGIHGIVSTRAIEQRVQNKSITTDPNANVRGPERHRAGDHR